MCPSMTSKPYIIRISSQKGGVGKTTIAVNLAIALSFYNSYKILLVDADLSNPSVGFHLGLSDANIGTTDVAKKTALMKSAIIIHAPSGIHVLPGNIIHSNNYIPTREQFNAFFSNLRKLDYDFIIIDTAPGLINSVNDVFKYYDEILVVTTPEMAAYTSAIRMAHLCNKFKTRHNLVVNRIRNKKFEIHLHEIEEAYGKVVVGALPEDDIVPTGIADHIPAYVLSRRDPFSLEIKEMAKIYAAIKGNIDYNEENGRADRKGGRVIHFILRLFGLSY